MFDKLVDFLRVGKSQKSERKVRVFCCSDSGRICTDNQDNVSFLGQYFPYEHNGYSEFPAEEISSTSGFSVAIFDGMGGESAGDLASYTAARYTAEHEKDLLFETDQAEAFLHRLNEAVYQAAKQEQYTSIGSTASIAVFREDRMIIADLGDSPVYRFRNGALELLSFAHTDEKLMEELKISGQKPRLTQYLGVQETDGILEPFVQETDLRPGDRILLCSDGLTDMVPEDGIREALIRHKGTEEAAGLLLQMALENGGTDNITVILADVI